MGSNSIEHKHPTKILNSETLKENNYGFSPMKSRDERLGRKAKSSSVVEEKMGNKYRRDGYVRQDVESVEKREMGLGVSSSKSRDRRVVLESKKTEVREGKVVDKVIVSKKSSLGKEKMDKKINASNGDGRVEEGEMRKRKRTRKVRVETPEIQLRVGLDMCSKRGDFLSAISLYDSAQREGVALGQYHYTVLLYLCSSAAVGVLRAAKSGSGSRTSDKLDFISEAPNGNSIDVSNTPDMDNENFGGRSAALSNEFLLDSSGGPGLSFNGDLEQNVYEKSTESHQHSNDFLTLGNDENDSSEEREDASGKEERIIQVSEDVKRYALTRGFEVYEKMCSEEIPLNEATLTSVARMAMSMGNGNMALEMVNKMKEMGINPRLRSYGPALFTFCNSGDIEKAFMVEDHMLENGVYPEEPELEALLKLSVEAGRGDKVYYVLHKLRKSVRKVSPSTADIIERWFRSKPASTVGKRKWDQRLIMEAMKNGGGGWHGQGWLGDGRWSTARTSVGSDGVCGCCGDKLVTIDLDSKETEDFAKSVATIAAKRERQSNFQNFQKWLDYYGPFEAVVDAANVGLFSQRQFSTSKVNAIVNGIRQKLPSKKLPLIVLHNRRTQGGKMDEQANKNLIEKWKNADALYATPTGSNDDWYWLYAAIKFKCLLVTNDEMRDHIFQLLGNDFFPRWKERHQVRFNFGEGGAVFYMPPPCSVVIQESGKGHWHIPIVSEDGPENERTWLCVTHKESNCRNKEAHVNGDAQCTRGKNPRDRYSNLKRILSESVSPNDDHTLVSDIEEAEKIGGCIIDFQI